jgi:serine/threonine protein kinase
MGCVLYEMAIGKPPFSASGLQDLIKQIQDVPVPHVDEMSPLFNDLLGRCLEKDPVKRISWEHLRRHPFWIKEIRVSQKP